MTNHAELLYGLDQIPMSDQKRARAEVAVRHSTAIVDFVLSIAYYARLHGRKTTRS
jgi:hypothetical protein